MIFVLLPDVQLVLGRLELRVVGSPVRTDKVLPVGTESSVAPERRFAIKPADDLASSQIDQGRRQRQRARWFRFALWRGFGQPDTIPTFSCAASGSGRQGGLDRRRC